VKVIVTIGPSYEPIDQVRRITNFSTGELGVLLSEELARSGFDVVCLKGVSATHPGPSNCHVLHFTTNDDLSERLLALSRSNKIAALFHVAALCDYKVRQVEDERGEKQQSAKIESRAGALTIVLEPAPKIIAALRELFPLAVIVGWKFELTGTRPAALSKAWRQIQENRTDACVLNGAAYGEGFALCTPPDRVLELHDKSAVAKFLPDWLRQRMKVTAPRV
jgi:phosphopantothenoylcysteine synthetase/decarboxylase